MFASFPYSRAAEKRSASSRCRLRWHTFSVPNESAGEVQKYALAVPALAQQADGLLHGPVRRQKITEDLPGERNRVLREDLANELLDLGAGPPPWSNATGNANRGQELG